MRQTCTQGASLAEDEKQLLKRRQANELPIGHTKADYRMGRCWLQGAVGDALHALCCAMGYNIRWLRRAIVRLDTECTRVAVSRCRATASSRGMPLSLPPTASSLRWV